MGALWLRGTIDFCQVYVNGRSCAYWTTEAVGAGTWGPTAGDRRGWALPTRTRRVRARPPAGRPPVRPPPKPARIRGHAPRSPGAGPAARGRAEEQLPPARHRFHRPL